MVIEISVGRLHVTVSRSNPNLSIPLPAAHLGAQQRSGQLALADIRDSLCVPELAE